MSESMVVPPTRVGNQTHQVGALFQHLAVGLDREVGPPYALGRTYS